MNRGATGYKWPISSVGEPCHAFVPNPLPPEPPLAWNAALFQKASVSLGRLGGVTSLLPDPHLFLYSYVRKEALLSSQIEGTQSSLSELLLFENDAIRGVPLDDVLEVSNYVAAMNHGLTRMREGFPLSLRLLREIHGHLLAKGRDSDKQPVVTSSRLTRELGLSKPTVNAALTLLVEQGVVTELTGQARSRIYAYKEYLRILGEGTEPL